jgi:NAD(P) transhydrogenase subunit beta
MLLESIIDLAYLVGAIAFVWGLRLLSSPDSARKGNILAAIGMAIGIGATFFVNVNADNEAVAPNNFAWIFGGLVVGGGIGWIASKKSPNDCHAADGLYFQRFGGSLCRSIRCCRIK